MIRCEGRRPTPSVSLRAGTRLVREWHAVTHTALIHADGIEWRGQLRPEVAGVPGGRLDVHGRGPSPLKPLHRGAAISSRKSFAARAAICLGVRIESFGSIFSSRAGISANVLARDLMIVRAVCAACAAWAACAVASGGGRRSIRGIVEIGIFNGTFIRA